jgi:SAM-dependent methyltransferase
MPAVTDAIRSRSIASIPWLPPRTVERSQSIGLRCPECRDFLIASSYRSLIRSYSSAYCTRCRAGFEQARGIWQGLPKRRLDYHAGFIEASEKSCREDGENDKGLEFYLALPFGEPGQGDSSLWAMRAKTFSYLQTKLLAEFAKQGDTPLHILDLGAGNGWMSHRLAQSEHRPVAVDLLTNAENGLGAAVHYMTDLPELFPRFQAEFENLPFDDGQFDCAIFNASFHYAENFDRTVAEAIRCLRPRGVLIIADSPTYSIKSRDAQLQGVSRGFELAETWFSTEPLAGREFLTLERLIALEMRHELEWSAHRCWYGIRWACRPWLAKWRNEVEPSQLVIYSAQVKTR